MLSIFLGAGQLPREMHTRLMLLINDVCKAVRYCHVPNDELRWTIQQPHFSVVVQAWCSHSVWIPNETDAKILTASPWRQDTLVLRGWKLKNYPAGPEIQSPLPEWSDWRGSELSTLEADVSTCGTTLLMVHARNKWMNGWTNLQSFLTFLGVLLYTKGFVGWQ